MSFRVAIILAIIEAIALRSLARALPKHLNRTNGRTKRLESIGSIDERVAALHNLLAAVPAFNARYKAISKGRPPFGLAYQTGSPWNYLPYKTADPLLADPDAYSRLLQSIFGLYGSPVGVPQSNPAYLLRSPVPLSSWPWLGQPYNYGLAQRLKPGPLIRALRSAYQANDGIIGRYPALPILQNTYKTFLNSLPPYGYESLIPVVIFDPNLVGNKSQYSKNATNAEKKAEEKKELEVLKEIGEEEEEKKGAKKAEEKKELEALEEIGAEEKSAKKAEEKKEMEMLEEAGQEEKSAKKAEEKKEAGALQEIAEEAKEEEKEKAEAAKEGEAKEGGGDENESGGGGATEGDQGGEKEGGTENSGEGEGNKDEGGDNEKGGGEEKSEDGDTNAKEENA